MDFIVTISNSCIVLMSRFKLIQSVLSIKEVSGICFLQLPVKNVATLFYSLLHSAVRSVTYTVVFFRQLVVV